MFICIALSCQGVARRYWEIFQVNCLFPSLHSINILMICCFLLLIFMIDCFMYLNYWIIFITLPEHCQWLFEWFWKKMRWIPTKLHRLELGVTFVAGGCDRKCVAISCCCICHIHANFHIWNTPNAPSLIKWVKMREQGCRRWQLLSFPLVHRHFGMLQLLLFGGWVRRGQLDCIEISPRMTMTSPWIDLLLDASCMTQKGKKI